MEVVQQLKEELGQAVRRKFFLEDELDSLKFSIAVMLKELSARTSQN